MTEFVENNDNEINIDRIWYGSLSNDPGVLNQLLNPKSAHDHLLKIRADPLLDHTRLYRVALQRARWQGASGVLDVQMRHYSDFDRYLSLLSDVDRMISEDVPAAYVLQPAVDAMCLKTDGGRVIIVSEPLRYFLYFMTLANLNLISDDLSRVPDDVRGSALVIAVRTMMLSEALDFDLDPRGVIPDELEPIINLLVDRQMWFIVGHEYAHHALGHAGAAMSKRMSGSSYIWNVYRRNWGEEFEADIRSISALELKDDREQLTQGSILALTFIHFYETVMGRLDSEFAEIDTHPPTEERLYRVVEIFGELIGVDEDWARRTIERQNASALELVEEFLQNPNLARTYGSVYLSSWRGKELIDRVDY